MQKTAKETWQKSAARDRHWKIEKEKKIETRHVVQNARGKKIEQEANAGWELNRRHMSHIRQCTCKLGHESRNAKVIVHVVRCGGEPFECGESTTNARGERNDTARYGERNEKNRQGTRKQCFPMVPTRFRHFCTFETNTQANERNEKKTETLSRKFVYRLIQMPNDVCDESRPKKGEAEQ